MYKVDLFKCRDPGTHEKQTQEGDQGISTDDNAQAQGKDTPGCISFYSLATVLLYRVEVQMSLTLGSKVLISLLLSVQDGILKDSAWHFQSFPFSSNSLVSWPAKGQAGWHTCPREAEENELTDKINLSP